MKISIYLLLAFLLNAELSSGQAYQEFPVSDASWNVARCWYLFGPGWNDTYEITLDGSDTLYDGYSYKKLFVKKHEIHGVWDSIYPVQFFGGIREIDKQVFMFQTWGTVDTTDHLIYDFTNTAVGDTIYTSALSGPPNIMHGHVVMDVDSVLVGSTFHKRLFLQDPNSIFNTEYWIEGVGSSWGLPYASFWSITDNSYDLTCFYESQDLLYGNPAPVFGFCTAPLPETNCGCLGGVTVNAAICSGDSLYVGGQYQYSSGAYMDTLLSSTGCDSIVTTQLNVNALNMIVSEANGSLLISANGDSFQWLDCDDSYSVIQGATNQTFNIPSNGSYAVSVTSNGCVDTSACYQVNNWGVIENDFGNSMQVSPNPTNGILNISFTEPVDKLIVSVLDMSGRNVQALSFEGGSSFNFTMEQPAGYYFLHINVDKRNARIKILKE